MNRDRLAGFTVIEVLVVMAVISVLVSLLLPAVQSARQSAQRIACASNLHQLALALHNYDTVHGVFPPGSQVQNFAGPHPWSKSIGWPIALLPYTEHAALYSLFDTNLDAQIHNRHVTKKSVSVYRCPADPNAEFVDWSPSLSDPYYGDYFKGGWGGNNYLGVSGTNGWIPTSQPTQCSDLSTTRIGMGLHDGMFFGNSAIRIADVLDGTSQTLLLGERGVTLGWGKWGGSGELSNCPMGISDVVLPGLLQSNQLSGGLRPAVGVLEDRMYWWSWHPQGTFLTFVDGSVSFTSYSINRNVVFSLTTRSGGDSQEY